MNGIWVIALLNGNVLSSVRGILDWILTTPAISVEVPVNLGLIKETKYQIWSVVLSSPVTTLRPAKPICSLS